MAHWICVGCALVWHVQPRVVIFPCPTHYCLTSVKCRTCRSTKTKFVSGKVRKSGDIVNALNAVTHHVKLPWTKFSGEMHWPGHNFTGPGSKLDKRQNADGTPKRWSKPVNRVDDAAYRHDLDYAGSADRIEADRKMINEIDDISNPTLRERMERAVARPILKAINVKQLTV